MRSFRYKPSKPVGIANILIATAMLVFGIVMTVRNDAGDRTFMIFWIAVALIVIAQFVWVTFSKKGSAGVLLPTRDEDR